MTKTEFVDEGSGQLLKQQLLADTCVVLPITGTCTQCEYVPGLYFIFSILIN
jgi:hypothetical protein